MAFISGEQGDKSHNYEGNWRTKIILGNIEHKIFSPFLGGKVNLLQGNKGTGTHLEGP